MKIVLSNEFDELDKTSYITSLTSYVTHVITLQAVMYTHSPMIYKMMLACLSVSKNIFAPSGPTFICRLLIF